VTRCDELAGDPYDIDRTGDGVLLKDLDADGAIDACSEAITASADAAPARLHYQLGRANQAAGNLDAAMAAYELASSGSAEAKSQIGYILRDGLDGSLNVTRAAALFAEAAEAGSVSGMTGYARAFEVGLGDVRVNEETASDWYKRAAEENYPLALHALANMYRDGRGVAENMQRAMQLYDRARARGLPSSAYNLAWLLDVAEGVGRNSRQAAEYFMDALASHEERFVEALQRDGKQLSAETRRALQQALKDGGFYAGAIDGSFGPETNRAIAAAGGQG
jgi:TPR repeat protein